MYYAENTNTSAKDEKQKKMSPAYFRKDFAESNVNNNIKELASPITWNNPVNYQFITCSMYLRLLTQEKFTNNFLKNNIA